MEFLRSQKRSVSSETISTIPHYLTAPSLDVRLEEFQLFAVDSLRVLKAISDGLARGRNHTETDDLVETLWKTNVRHLDASQMVNKDIISHFVLRLVYCRT